jgi:hypothetical protein
MRGRRATLIGVDLAGYVIGGRHRLTTRPIGSLERTGVNEARDESILNCWRRGFNIDLTSHVMPAVPTNCYHRQRMEAVRGNSAT